MPQKKAATKSASKPKAMKAANQKSAKGAPMKKQAVETPEPPTTKKRKEDKHHYRTVWISDIHLGTRDCKAEWLLDFLKHVKCKKLYLVGDIIDGWRLKRGWHWPQSHSTVMQKILRLSRKGVDVRYIPGNHDEFLRDYVGIQFGAIQLLQNDVHETADGKRLLVMHGDEFDSVANVAPWLAHIGDKAYYFALRINNLFNKFRVKRGKSYFSLSAMLKKKVKQAVNVISNFEGFIAEAAKHHKVDGVVCGHIHHAEMRDIDGVLYCNDGDWVESCTALVEHDDGTLEIIYWASDVMKGRLPEGVEASG